MKRSPAIPEGPFSETTVRLNSITIPEIEEKTAAIESMLAAEKPPAVYNAYWEKTGIKPVGCPQGPSVP